MHAITVVRYLQGEHPGRRGRPQRSFFLCADGYGKRDENKTLACCATLQSDVVIEAEVDEEPDAEQIAIEDFEGTVSRIETLTPTIKGIWIDVDGEGVPFQAGQYINLVGRGTRASTRIFHRQPAFAAEFDRTQYTPRRWRRGDWLLAQ